jgi:YVTN family beta-propeller protein
VAVVAAALVAGSLSLALAPSAGAGQAAPSPAPTDAPVLARARTFAQAFAGRGAAAVRRAETAGALALADPLRDATDPRADIESVQATFTTSMVRVGATTVVGSDPTRDPAWTVDGSGIGWGIDTTADGNVDAVAIMISTSNGRLGGVVVDANGSAVRCLAAASWDRARTYSLTFPPSCVHASGSLRFGAFTAYGTTTTSSDYAPDTALAGPVAPTSTAAGVAGALVLDGWGGLHFTGVGSARTNPGMYGAPYWKGWDIARGVALVPGGGYGFVVDGFGGLHGFGLGQDAMPVATTTTAYWRGRDVARGVAVLADGSGGFVLDMSGGLHWFSIGDGAHSPKLYGLPSWPGADVARGVALAPNGSGGWIVDLYGGLHWFSIGTPHAAPVVIGAPYWRGWDIARGVDVMPDGSGGYVIDAWGGLQWFSIGAKHARPTLSGAPYWKGWQVARGVGAIPAAPALPPEAPTPTTTTTTTPAPTTTTTTTTTPPAGPNGTLVPISGTPDNVVTDAAGRYAYVTNSSANVVDVLDLQARAFVVAIPVGSTPMGLDLTPDGSLLYVANSGGNNISVIDVASRTEVRRITVPPIANDTRRPFDIAIASNGTALVTTTFSGSGWGGHVLQMNLATDAMSLRADAGMYGEATDLTTATSSGDHSKIVVAYGNDSLGPVTVYDATTNGFSPMANMNWNMDGTAVNGDGSVILAQSMFVLNGDLSLAGTIQQPATTWPRGQAIDRRGVTGYRALDNTSTVQVLDTVRFLTVSTLTLPDTVDVVWGNTSAGIMAVTPDGSTLAVITDHGVSIRSTS